MHNIVIDIGNTNSKVAVFKSGVLVFFEKSQQLDSRRIAELLEEYGVQNAAVSSVNKEETAIRELLKAKTNYIDFSTVNNPGIVNHYATPETLGLDRWAKVIAAHQLYRGADCLLIDAGTCITYDVLTNANYYGGSISLGIQMRFQALAHFTGRLPLVAWNAEAEIPAGTDTVTAIQSGVLQGILNEVEGYIATQYHKNNKVKVLITGGDALFFVKQLKANHTAAEIIHEPYLVLKGLNEVIAFEYVQKN